MSFFNRLGNIISGKANKALDKAENPIEQKITQYEEGIRKALATSDEDKATTFLMKKKEFDSELSSLESTLTTLKVTAEKVKSNVLALEKEVKELKTKKSELAARYSTAKAQTKVNEILTEVNKDSHISLSDIEQKVMDAENYAQGLEEFKRPNVDSELNDYLSEGPNTNLQDELNKYR
ncbi:MAG: PspA/IM30 family protein [Cellulosilyticaceae bacterium]